MTNIELFFKDDIIKLQEESEFNTYVFKSAVYPKIFEDMAEKRKDKYIKIFGGIKPKIEKILKDAETGFDRSARVLLNSNNKESIALAILAMRNELIDNKNSNINLIGDSYKSGFNVPEKIMNYKFQGKKSFNDMINKIKEDYENDINNFIEDFSERIDGISDEYDKKQIKGINWTWAALLGAIVGLNNSLHYRLSLISKEPFRKAFKIGIVHGIEKSVEEQGKQIVKVIWEATGTHPCEDCQSLDGQEISMNEAESYMHPNCSCSLRVTVK